MSRDDVPAWLNEPEFESETQQTQQSQQEPKQTQRQTQRGGRSKKHRPLPVSQDGRIELQIYKGDPVRAIDEIDTILHGRGVPIFVQAGRLAMLTPIQLPEQTLHFYRECPTHAPPGYAIVPLNSAKLMCIYGENILMTQYDGRAGEALPIDPPERLAAMHLARDKWPYAPVRSVASHPILTYDNVLIDTEGYVAEAQVYIAPGAAIPTVPTAPTQGDARAAYDVLMEPFSEFPCKEPGDWAAIAAAILTILHRFTTAGQRPLFLVTSSTRGTGKSRLANLIGTIATGIEPHGDSPTDDPDEEKKRMLAYALAGKHVLCFDNIADSLGNAALDAILTQSSISGRVLGATRVVEGDNKFVLFATGNNPAIAEDTRRRTVEIRIDSGEERPENRNFTRSWSELEAFVAKNRPALLTAAFTILRAHTLAGKPRISRSRLGSFEAWDDTIRQAVIWASGDDPCHRQATAANQAIPELATLFSALLESFPAFKEFTVRDIITKASNSSNLRDAIGELKGYIVRGNEINAKALGKAIAHFNERTVDGHQLLSRPSRTGVLCYRLAKVTATTPPEVPEQEF